MKITAFGINHTTAPVQMRERAVIADDRVQDAVLDLTQHPQIKEATILSTCNRTEIYFGHDDLDDQDCIVNWLSDFQKLPQGELSPFTYSHQNKDA
ncbi:MAG: hypothetical protein V3V09_07940, partial [Arenicellales bacterium]